MAYNNKLVLLGFACALCIAVIGIDVVIGIIGIAGLLVFRYDFILFLKKCCILFEIKCVLFFAALFWVSSLNQNHWGFRSQKISC